MLVNPNTLNIEAVTFKSVHDRRPKPFNGTPIALLGQHRPWHDKKDAPCFSIVTYREGARRGNEGVESLTALVLDFDHLTPEQAGMVLERATRTWAFIAYSSFSHDPNPDPKEEAEWSFRLVLFVDRPYAKSEYLPLWHVVNNRLGGVADDKARDVSRVWCKPSCRYDAPATDRLYVVQEGAAIDVDELLAEARATENQSRWPKPGAIRKTATPQAIREGGRNDSLMRLGASLRARGLDEDQIRAALLDENSRRCVPPLEAEEVHGIARSVARYTPNNPLLGFNLTDWGNAERLVHTHGEDLRFVTQRGRWLRWEGGRWRAVDGASLLPLALQSNRATFEAAKDITDPEYRERVTRHTMRSESLQRLKATTQLAASLLPIDAEQLDRDPMRLTVENGTIDLRDGTLSPHSRGDFITRKLNVVYDEAAPCPRWEAFLRRSLGGDVALMEFVQRAVGYSLSGSTNEQALLVLKGTGANGKSTFLSVLRALLGEYALAADFASFLAGPSTIRNDLARLAGARLVSASEPERGRPLAESLVKQLTGEDPVTARFLFGEFFEFVPNFKLWLCVNRLPQIHSDDDALWRRLRVVPFDNVVPEHERDPKLLAQLLDELPGILAWAVRGCLGWQREGLGQPPAVAEATRAWREGADSVRAFVGEVCELRDEGRVDASALYEAYLRWCEGSAETPLGASAFGVRLSALGFTRVKGAQGRRRWAGLVLGEVKAEEPGAVEAEVSDVMLVAEEAEVAEVAEVAAVIMSSWSLRSLGLVDLVVGRGDGLVLSGGAPCLRFTWEEELRASAQPRSQVPTERSSRSG
ncbi:phage/plasmid primase, P4 family [Myxococcota bacterium]|nr:phage/plasmid primase, P4 family [Myxococcota bacterium]